MDLATSLSCGRQVCRLQQHLGRPKGRTASRVWMIDPLVEREGRRVPTSNPPPPLSLLVYLDLTSSGYSSPMNMYREPSLRRRSESRADVCTLSVLPSFSSYTRTAWQGECSVRDEGVLLQLQSHVRENSEKYLLERVLAAGRERHSGTPPPPPVDVNCWRVRLGCSMRWER